VTCADSSDALSQILGADGQFNDEAAARLVDLIYALGDFVASHYENRIRRHYQRQREQALALQPNVDPRQLDLFPTAVLDPF
jgi:hypothetical protein